MQRHLEAIAAQLSCPETLGRILLDMVEDGSIAIHLEGMLQTVADGRAQELLSANANSVLLHIEPGFRLHLRRHAAPREGVLTTAADRHLVTTASDCVVVLRSKAPISIAEFHVAEDGSHLEQHSERPYAGEVLHESAGENVVRSYQCRENVCMLRLNYGLIQAESRFYARDSLSYLYTGAVTGLNTSLVTLCQVFAATGDREAVTLLQSLAQHEAHFVRWSAIQALGRLDRAVAMETLRRAVNDVHPEIRAAAARTLQRTGS